MVLDEGNGDGESVDVKFDTCDGARRISCPGERVADLFAESCILRKVDIICPSDIVGVEKKRL